MNLTRDEEGCLEWFIHRTSTKLSGAFVSNKATTLLLQASSTEPAVLHAVLALSSAHREVIDDHSYRALLDSSYQELLTVRQYNKAIGNLQPHFLSQSKASTCVTLVACIIFVHLEFLRGKYTIGMKHLQHGLNLLQDADLAIAKEHGGSTGSTSSLENWVVTILRRILIPVKLMGQTVQIPHNQILSGEPVPKVPFVSVHQARRSLESLIVRILRLSERCTYRNGTPELSCDDQQLVQSDLRQWTLIHRTTTEHLPRTTNLSERSAYRLLELYHLMATIMAVVQIGCNQETAYDRHTVDFVTIISHCIQSYKFACEYHGLEPARVLSTEQPGSRALPNMGWITPLYYTAVKCRNHRIRLHAIKLLELMPHREGIWDASQAAVIARKVVAIEEQDFYKDIDIVNDFDLLSAPNTQELLLPVLPEDHRLNAINLVLPDDPTSKLVLRCTRRAGLEKTLWKYDLGSRTWSDFSCEIEVGSCS